MWYPGSENFVTEGIRLSQQSGGLEQAEATLAEKTEALPAFDATVQDTEADLSNAREQCAELSREVECFSAENDKMEQTYFVERFRNPAVDAHAYADDLTRRKAWLQLDRDTLTFWRAKELPRLELARVFALAEQATAKCAVAGQKVIVASIRRTLAASTLAQVEGVVNFEYGQGLTGQLDLEASYLYKQAYRVREEFTDLQTKLKNQGVIS